MPSPKSETPGGTGPVDEDASMEGDMLDISEAAEEIPSDTDALMDSDGDDDNDADEANELAEQEIAFENDSSAHFDAHTDSVFCIAQHPRHPEIVATGGGDDVGYVFDSTPAETPVLPDSYRSEPRGTTREGQAPLFKLEGHTDSLNGITFTLPKGEYLVSAGLDGRLRTWRDTSKTGSGRSWAFVGEVQEVDEISWLKPCPHPAYPNTVALGASDGSVWVYSINADEKDSPLTIVQAFYLHTEASTAGAWSPDGKLLATVSEDGSFYVYDVFGEAAAAGLTSIGDTGQAVVGLTAEDQRFAVEGGLFSVAISETGALAVVGGAGGNVKVVGLPRIGANSTVSAGSVAKGAVGRTKTGSKPSGGTSAGGGQAGQILASIQAQSEGIETLSFSAAPLNLLAAGSIDGSIAIFDSAHRFAVRRHIREAHGEHAVVKVEFVKDAGDRGWYLTSAGMDGSVKRWDTRSGTPADQGLLKEWKGHRGDGEGGGVLDFVQGRGGDRIVTAGDDGVCLVFEALLA
ncbi:MAG: hypothetical protein M1825_001301 [Sarcosagium campestre]|nr:MAG: hypothetical protein M1825_001301 [Sarcosagium campestre]